MNKQAQQSLTWISTPPNHCDKCGCQINQFSFFVDGLCVIAQEKGRTVKAAWCIMCPPCFENFGLGLGLGRGQMFSTSSLVLIAGNELPTLH